jgi:uncharacterized protein HemY
MIESPLLKGLVAEAMHRAILEVLKTRFKKVPREVRRLLAETTDEDRLVNLNVTAAQCDSMDDFKERLLK